MRITSATLIFVAVISANADAHQWTAQECRQVSEFLRNAAMSRDYGMSADEFLGRMRSDIELVRAFPPDLRWVVADTEDELMLLDAATQVFAAPIAPERHESEFLSGCLHRFAHAPLR